MSRELKGIAIILVVYLVGEIIAKLLSGYMPGNVIGMLLLFILLQCKVVKEEDIKGVCNFILSNMMLLFVPVTVGIMSSYDIIKGSWLATIATLVLSAIIVLVTVGRVQQYFGRKWRQ
ncbi:MAG: CidA/LrgA family protein [Rikenellaceae bacterium]